MSDEIQTSSAPRKRRALLMVACAVCFSAAWLFACDARFRMALATAVGRTPGTAVWIGAIAWYAQLLGVVCAFVALSGTRFSRDCFCFAAVFPLAFGSIWWIGLYYSFRDLDLVEAAIHVILFEYGVESLIDSIIFRGFGPMINPLQLRGPMMYDGWNFLLVALSTTLIVGYLLFVGRAVDIGRPGGRSVRDIAKFIVLVLPLYLPLTIKVTARFVAAWNVLRG